MMLLGEDQEDTGFEADGQRRSNLEQLEPLFRLDAEGVQRAAWELAGDTPLLDAGEIFLGGLNQAFVAARLGMDQEAVAANWPILRESYARAAYGSDPRTEEEFKGLAAQEMTQWRRTEDARTFESIYAGTSNGVVLPVEKPPQWWTPGGGVEEKLAGANRAYFSFLQGKELDDQEYADTRRTYARENLGKEDASDGEVFFHLGDRFTTEKLKREVQQKASDFWRKTQTRWAAGREQAGNDQLAYRALTGEVPWESVKDQLEPKTDVNSARGESWYGDGFLGAVETLPAMIESMAEGSRKGVAFAAAGATAAVVGGQAGPQAAAPEEIITVPSAAIMGYSVGETSGMTDYWFRQGAGSLYHELRKEGIPHGVAQKVSLAFGVPYAGVELVQMSKLVPGMKQTVARTVAGAVKQRMLALAREKGVEYVEQIGQETTQEILQIAAEALAEGVAGVRAPEDKRPALGRIWDTITQTMTSMPFLMLPKMATDTVAAARGGSQAARPARAPGLLDVLTPEQQSYVATAPNVEAMLGRYQEIVRREPRIAYDGKLRKTEKVNRNESIPNPDVFSVENTIAFEEYKEGEISPRDEKAIKNLREALGSRGENLRAVKPSKRLLGHETGREGPSSELKEIKYEGSDIGVFVEAFQKAFKKQVIFLHADGLLPDAMALEGEKDRIFVDSLAVQGIDFLLGHELIHIIKNQNRAIYDRLVGGLLPLAREMESHKAKIQRLSIEGYADVELNDEVIGDFIGGQFTKREFWEKIEARDETLFQALARAALKVIEKIISVFRELPRDAEPVFKDNLEEARDFLIARLNDYVSDTNSEPGLKSDNEVLKDTSKKRTAGDE